MNSLIIVCNGCLLSFLVIFKMNSLVKVCKHCASNEPSYNNYLLKDCIFSGNWLLDAPFSQWFKKSVTKWKAYCTFCSFCKILTFLIWVWQQWQVIYKGRSILKLIALEVIKLEPCFSGMNVAIPNLK